MRQESSRCGDIVKNLLSFARQSRNVFSEQSLNAIVDRSTMTVQHLFKTNGVECTVEPLAPDDRVVCDGNEIQQALVALLVNAAEAMPKGGQLRVTSIAKGDDQVELSIADTGVGIPPDVLPEIFEPFFSTKGDEKGVVLGVTSEDLYFSIFTSVIGEACLGGRAAVVSTHRLHDERYGLPPNPERLRARLLKEAVHELGHCHGLVHCSSTLCVMHASSTAEEVDSKGSEPCVACERALAKRQAPSASMKKRPAT